MTTPAPAGPPASAAIGSKRSRRLSLALTLAGGLALSSAATPADASGKLVCRKVVAETVTGEGRNTGGGSRVKCAPGEMLTGGTCYAETRPEEDGSCQTAGSGIIQQIIDHPETTEEAFFTCLQTMGSDCPVEARTRAMAICCKIVDEEEEGKE